MRPIAVIIAALSLSACGSGLESTGFPDNAADLGSPDPDPDPDTDTGLPTTSGPDEDGDGLPDGWETAANDPARLSPLLADTDGNGINDGQEDLDGDGLDNATEHRLSAVAIASGVAPHPLRRDLLVELDSMAGTSLSDAVLADAAAAYAALPEPIGLLVFRDQTAIPAMDFDGSFEQRHDFLKTHGPTNLAGLPVEHMIHAAVVTRRLDEEFRGGEVVTDGEGDVEKTGVLIFYDALAALHPQCGLDGDPPDITLDEALASTFAHELGHVLQLGHEDDTGGGTNYFNIMSVPTTCNEAQQRFHGVGNTDTTLGATNGSTSRFSDDAARLMRFDERLSVDTAEFLNGTGQPM